MIRGAYEGSCLTKAWMVKQSTASVLDPAVECRPTAFGQDVMVAPGKYEVGVEVNCNISASWRGWASSILEVDLAAGHVYEIHTRRPEFKGSLAFELLDVTGR